MTPVVETPRLRLRGHRPDDLDASLAMWQAPQVYEFIAGRPGTREECWGRLLRYAGHWQMCGFGYWLVETADSGEFVGEVGFSDFKRDVTPSIEETLEAGWVLAPSAHGKGYATEAVQAALGWRAQHFADRPVTCLIHPGNAASIRVAEKTGFVRRCIGQYKGMDELIMDLAEPVPAGE